MATPQKVTVETVVGVPREKAWKYFTEPEHIVQWNYASSDWECPRAENDLSVGGRLRCRMQAKDGSTGFDLEGTYTEVAVPERLAYAMGDRTVEVVFEDKGGATRIVETFDAEDENPIDMQRAGWQAILDTYKAHAERQ